METTFTPKTGMRVAQTINGNTYEMGVITRVAGDVMWTRPDEFDGRPNYRRSFALHRTFWATVSEIK